MKAIGKRLSKSSDAERQFALLLTASFPRLAKSMQREYRFAPPRRWKFDFAWPESKFAVEIEGGIWMRGRHVRAQGYQNDIEKYNAATIMGWKVIRFTPDMLREQTKYVVETIKSAYKEAES